MKRKNYSAFAIKRACLYAAILLSIWTMYALLVFYPIECVYKYGSLFYDGDNIRMIIKSNSNAVREIILALLREQ